MNEKIIDYIVAQLANNELDDDLEVEDDLLGSGLINSLGMMKLILFIETEFHVQVPPEDMTIENFMTVGHITTYLENKK